MLPTHAAVVDPPLFFAVAVIALAAPLTYTSPSPPHLPSYRRRRATYIISVHIFATLTVYTSSYYYSGVQRFASSSL